MVPQTEKSALGVKALGFGSKLVWQDSVDTKFMASEPGSLGSSLYPDLLDMCLQASHMTLGAVSFKWKW